MLATVLGSAMASIDTTVVGIALPAIGRDFGASLTVLQWVVTAYTLTLAGLLLFAGTLGDRYGTAGSGSSWPASYGSRCPDGGPAVHQPFPISPAGTCRTMTATWRGLEQVDVVLEHLGRVPAQGEGGHCRPPGPSRSSANTSRVTPAKAWTPWPETVTSEVAALVSGSSPGPAAASGRRPGGSGMSAGGGFGWPARSRT